MLRGQSLLHGVVLLAFCLLATGCLFPYVYPKLAFVPGCDPAGPKVADIHAFRVDVSAHEVDVGEDGEITLTPISLGSNSSVPPQIGLSLEHGIYVLGIAVNYNVGWLHDTRVRLYSRGYQLIELKSWDSANAIRWQIADDWSAREQAVDDLLRRPAVSNSENALRRHDTERGSSQSDLVRSKATMQAMRFAAAEYEEIAAHVYAPADAARLKKKAQDLRTVETVPKREGTP